MLEIIIHVGDLYLQTWEEGIVAGQDIEFLIEDLQSLLTLYFQKYKYDHLYQQAAIYLLSFITEIILNDENSISVPIIIQEFDSLFNEDKQKIFIYANNTLYKINSYMANQIVNINIETISTFYEIIQVKITSNDLVNSQIDDMYLYNKHCYDVINDYYEACYHFEMDDYDKCANILEKRVVFIKDIMSDFAVAMSYYMLAYYSNSNGDMETTKIHALEAKNIFPIVCQQYIQTLVMLLDIYYFQKDAKLHNNTASELLDSYISLYCEKDSLYLNLLLEIGAQYYNFGNIPRAKKHFDESKMLISDFYGKDSKWLDYFEYYESLLSMAAGDYETAKSKLDKAFRVVNNLSSVDSTDEFTIYVSSDRDNLIEHFSEQSIVLLSRMENDQFDNLALFNKLFHAFLVGDKKKALMIATEMGISKELQQNLPVDSKLFSFGIMDIPKVAHAFATLYELYGLSLKNESDYFDDLSDENRVRSVERLINALKTIFSVYDKESLPYKMYKRHFIEMVETACDGFLKCKRPDKSLSFMIQHEDFDKSAAGELYFTSMKCLLYDQSNDKDNAQFYIARLLELQHKLISQIITIDSEQKQLELIEYINHGPTLAKSLYLILKYKEKGFAYEYLLRNKILSLDYSYLSRLYKNSNKVEDFFYKEMFEAQYSSITAKLDYETILIEFAKVWYEVRKEKYCAFIINGDGITAVVDLGDTEQMNGLIARFNKSLCAGYEAKELHNLDGYWELYRVIAVPILEKLAIATKKIIIAPEGKLFLLPFELFLNIPKKEHLISYVYSGKDLLRKRQSIKIGKNSPCLIISSQGSAEDVDLPSALHEANVIAETLNSKVYIGDEVKKNLFYNVLDNNYGLIHIATHGEFKLDEKDIMSGAYLKLSGDEILTAREVSQLDFAGVELAVLSACKTGDGLDASFEGLLGLSRAFTIAGTQNLIVGLWEMGDFPTALLMKQFYLNYIDRNLSINEALENAKSYLRNLKVVELRPIAEKMEDSFERETLICAMEGLNDDTKFYRYPYYWASFICYTY